MYVCHINPVIMNACYRRSKDLQSLCFLLYIVMLSLNKISYLIQQNDTSPALKLLW